MKFGEYRVHTVCAAKSANPQENAGRYSLGNAGCQHQIAQYVHPSSASGSMPNATTTESGPAGVENGRSAMPETNNAKATWSCQRIVTRFITLEQGRKPTPELKEQLRKWVAKEIGSLAKPDDIRFTDMLPKTRSGKIMRRLLRELATNGDVKGDTTTLEDFSVIARLKEDEEA